MEEQRAAPLVQPGLLDPGDDDAVVAGRDDAARKVSRNQPVTPSSTGSPPGSRRQRVGAANRSMPLVANVVASCCCSAPRKFTTAVEARSMCGQDEVVCADPEGDQRRVQGQRGERGGGEPDRPAPGVGGDDDDARRIPAEGLLEALRRDTGAAGVVAVGGADGGVRGHGDGQSSLPGRRVESGMRNRHEACGSTRRRTGVRASGGRGITHGCGPPGNSAGNCRFPGQGRQQERRAYSLDRRGRAAGACRCRRVLRIPLSAGHESIFPSGSGPGQQCNVLN